MVIGLVTFMLDTAIIDRRTIIIYIILKLINTRADEMRADLHKLLFLSLVPVFLNLFDITNVLELKYSFVTQISVLFKVRCLRYVPFDDHILCILKKKKLDGNNYRAQIFLIQF